MRRYMGWLRCAGKGGGWNGAAPLYVYVGAETIYYPINSLMASSTIFLSSGWDNDPPTCPQIEGISLKATFGISDASSRLSSAQKYWSVDVGIMKPFAVIDPKAALKSPL